MVAGQRAQDAFGGVALLVIDRRIERERQLTKCFLKFRRRFLCFLADVNEVQFRAEAVAHAFGLGKDLNKARRESAGHGDNAIR